MCSKLQHVHSFAKKQKNKNKTKNKKKKQTNKQTKNVIDYIHDHPYR